MIPPTNPQGGGLGDHPVEGVTIDPDPGPPAGQSSSVRRCRQAPETRLGKEGKREETRKASL